MVSRTLLEEAITEYNEYRSPVATAALVDHADGSFTVRFEGSFCRTCCGYDYFEDLIYELDALGEDAESMDIGGFTYEGSETFVVEYTVSPAGAPRPGSRDRLCSVNNTYQCGT